MLGQISSIGPAQVPLFQGFLVLILAPGEIPPRPPVWKGSAFGKISLPLFDAAVTKLPAAIGWRLQIQILGDT